MSDAAKNKPTKPLTPYFRFRNIKGAIYKGQPGYNDKINEDWKNLDEKEKQKIDDEYRKDLEAWRVKNEEWKKKHGSDAEAVASKKSKSKEK